MMERAEIDRMFEAMDRALKVDPIRRSNGERVSAEDLMLMSVDSRFASFKDCITRNYLRLGLDDGMWRMGDGRSAFQRHDF